MPFGGVQVLRYLQAFAAAFRLHQYITFDTEVVSAVPLFPDQKDVPQHQQQQQHHQQQEQHQQQHQQQQPGSSSSRGDGSCSDDEAKVQPLLPWPRWQITTQPVQHNLQGTPSTAQTAAAVHNGYETHDGAHANGHANNASDAHVGSDGQTDGHSQTTTYDALVVCNGHYSAPRCPDVSEFEAFPGTVMHSHNYRRNEAFRGQTVVLVGASASGEDICREIAEVAEKVILNACSICVCNPCTLCRVLAL